MRTIVLWLIGVATLAGPSVQQKPDFSGEWVLEAGHDPSPDTARELTVRQVTERTSSVRGVPLDRTSIQIRRRNADGIHADAYEIGIIGGTVNGDGSRTNRSVQWLGQTLIIETGSYSGPPGDPGTFAERREEWSLGVTGRLVIIVEDRGSGRKPATTTSIYKRQ